MKRAVGDPARPVPTVDFYGDATPWSTSALLHSELLTERSRRHAWKIRPHRHSSIAQLFWLQHGSGTARFDGEPFELAAPCIVVVPELCVHEFEWRKGSTGFAMSIVAGLVQDLRREIGKHGGTFREPAAVAAGSEAGFVNGLFERIHHEYVNEHPMKEIALDGLVRSLAVWLARRTAPVRKSAETTNRAHHHFDRFARLVDRHHRSQWTVARYAQEIGITPSHLNSICQQLGGKSALRVIHDRVLLAARRELAYTEKSIADVGADLGFAEPSYFTRFFKRQMDMTPKEYRRRSGTMLGTGLARV